MELFSDLTRGAYLLLALIIGLRLLWRYRSSRQLPELLMATCLLSGGVLYNGFVFAWLRTSLPQSEHVGLIIDLMRPTLAVSALSVAIFAWRTARRDSAWAPFLVLTVAALMLVWLGNGWFGDPASSRRGFPWVARVLSLLTSYLWVAVESFLYYRNAKRRQRIGLPTDPLTKNQSFFLGLSFTTFSVFWGAAALSLVIGTPTPEGLLGVTGLLRVVGLWLAFLPPVAFTQWLLRRANAPSEVAA